MYGVDIMVLILFFRRLCNVSLHILLLKIFSKCYVKMRTA